MKKIRTISVIIIIMAMFMESALAENWAVRFIYNGPTASNVFSCTVGKYVSTATSSVKENCTYNSNPQDSLGRVGYVSYNLKYVTNTGDVHSNIAPTYYHFSTQTTHTITISTAPAKSTVYATYSLHYYSSSAVFSGGFGDV